MVFQADGWGRDGLGTRGWEGLARGWMMERWSFKAHRHCYVVGPELGSEAARQYGVVFASAAAVDCVELRSQKPRRSTAWPKGVLISVRICVGTGASGVLHPTLHALTAGLVHAQLFW